MAKDLQQKLIIINYSLSATDCLLLTQCGCRLNKLQISFPFVSVNTASCLYLGMQVQERNACPFSIDREAGGA